MKPMTDSVVRLFLGCLLAVTMTACVTPGPQNQREGRFGTSPLPFLPPPGTSLTAPLAEVKQGNPFYDIYLLGWQKNTAINPDIKPGPFRESDEIQANCGAGGGLGDLTSTSGNVFFDRSAYDALMRTGQEIAKDRHIWQFNMARAQAQHSNLEGLGRRTGAGQAAPRRPTAPSRVREANESARGVPITQSSPPKAPLKYHGAEDVVQAQKALNYNLEILEKINKEISEREDKYLGGLAALYSQAYSQIRASLSSASSFDVLNRYELIRERNIMLCAMRAQTKNSANRQKLDDINQQSRDVVLAYLRNSKARIVAEMDSKQLIADKQRIYETYFKTVSLQKLAAAEIGLQPPNGIAQRAPGQSELLTLD